MNAVHLRRGYDLAESAVDRLRRAEITMSPLNFELWFRAEEYPASPLATELAAIEAERRRLTEEDSGELAARFLPGHRLAHEARQSGEQLAAQLDLANQALVQVQASQKTYGLNLDAGAAALGSVSDAGAVRRVVSHLSAATANARREASNLGAALAAATAEVSRLKDHMEAIRRESLTDGLTGLPNRKAFDTALARACAGGDSITVAMIDVDHFKRFNDTWGHATGDQVLKFVAAMVGRTGHAPRLAARYGGEEFAMLFQGEDAGLAAVDLQAMQARIRSRVLTRRTTGEQLGSLTVSVGLATGAGQDASDLMAAADEALYTSKRDGRDRLTLADALPARPEVKAA